MSDPNLFDDMGLVREPLHEQIADRIQQLVAEQHLRPGGRLPPERDLALQLGVSRPTLREAMRLLEHRGLVSRRAGSGTYVIQMNAGPVTESLDRFFWVTDCTFEDLAQVREMIEPGAAALAAVHASKEDIVGLQEKAQRLEEAFATGQPTRLSRAEVEFHGALADASGNQLLAAITASLSHLTEKWAVKHSSVVFDPDVNRAHCMIVEGIVARDPNRAREAASLHMQLARRAYADHPVVQAIGHGQADK